MKSSDWDVDIISVIVLRNLSKSVHKGLIISVTTVNHWAIYYNNNRTLTVAFSTGTIACNSRTINYQVHLIGIQLSTLVSSTSFFFFFFFYC